MSKDLEVYTREADEQAARVKQCVAESKEAWEVKKHVCYYACRNSLQEEIFRDCAQMVPDTRGRLLSACADMEAYLVRGSLSLLTQHGINEASQGTEAHRDAVDTLDAAQKQLAEQHS